METIVWITLGWVVGWSLSRGQVSRSAYNDVVKERNEATAAHRDAVQDAEKWKGVAATEVTASGSLRAEVLVIRRSSEACQQVVLSLQSENKDLKAENDRIRKEAARQIQQHRVAADDAVKAREKAEGDVSQLQVLLAEKTQQLDACRIYYHRESITRRCLEDAYEKFKEAVKTIVGGVKESPAASGVPAPSDAPDLIVSSDPAMPALAAAHYGREIPVVPPGEVEAAQIDGKFVAFDAVIAHAGKITKAVIDRCQRVVVLYGDKVGLRSDTVCERFVSPPAERGRPSPSHDPKEHE